MTELILIIIPAILFFLQYGNAYYPDSLRYSAGINQHYPFNIRLLRLPDKLWDFVRFFTVVTLPLLTYYYLIPFTTQAFWGGLLVCGLSGVFHQNIKGYKLIDSTAIWLGLMSAIMFRYSLLLGLLFLILASLTKETMPVFIALWSMSFIPLVGFIVPAVVYILNPPAENDLLGKEHENFLTHPFEAFKQYHLKGFLHPIYFLSWGICASALFYTGEYWQWILAGVLISYAQLLVATDRVRLFQYSFPLVLIATCNVIELNVFWFLIHLYNPYHFVEQGWDKATFEKRLKALSSNG